MGREGKVASPALRGNANPRLLRHKLVYTTLSKRSEYSEWPKLYTCRSATAARGGGRTPGPGHLPAARPALPTGPPGATGPGGPRAAQCKRMATRRSCQGQPTAAREGRRERATRGSAKDARGRGTGRAATGPAARTAGPSARDEGLPDRHEPPAGRLHFTHLRRRAVPAGLAGGGPGRPARPVRRRCRPPVRAERRAGKHGRGSRQRRGADGTGQGRDGTPGMAGRADPGRAASRRHRAG